MAIAKLNLVSLDFDKDNCNDVLLELYQRDDFHPELASKFTDSVAGLSAYNNDNLYEELLSRICLGLAGIVAVRYRPCVARLTDRPHQIIR